MNRLDVLRSDENLRDYGNGGWYSFITHDDVLYLLDVAAALVEWLELDPAHCFGTTPQHGSRVGEALMPLLEPGRECFT